MARKLNVHPTSRDGCDNEASELTAPHVKVTRRRTWASLVVVLACLSGVANTLHTSTLFENDRHFSHLSNLEREMTFRTEMGLYYSYYKTLVEAPSIVDGIHSLLHDNRTEYPEVMNTIRRFNLYPELVLGIAFRAYADIAEKLGFSTRTCWMVYRGGNLPDAESCEGLGDPPSFYVTAVFLWNGLISAGLFVYGLLLSDSIFGGVISVLCFFYNHGDCTRVQWTPPLRESFAYPIFVWQALATSLFLRRGGSTLTSVAITFLTVAFHLCWQFAQFALLTQCMSLFACFVLQQIPLDRLRSLIVHYAVALVIANILLFQNEMLLTSLYASFLLSAIVVIKMFALYSNKLKKQCVSHWEALALPTVVVVLSIVVKLAFSRLLGVASDVHIWNILLSKMTRYKDFHTMLYTCAPEFDFLNLSTVLSLTWTLLIPSSIICCLSCVFVIIAKPGCKSLHGAVLYNILQAAVFCAMAAFVMRLKVFMTPHLSIIVALLSSKHFFSFIKSTRIYASVIVALVATMTFQGIKNVRNQRSIIGEYSNPNLEELLLWVNNSTPETAVFAGPMSTMANLLLSTRRPIVNHPHYEHAPLRERTKRVYLMYSRMTLSELHTVLSSMKAQYLVVGSQWCQGRSRTGCSLTDIWDATDGKTYNKKDDLPACVILQDPDRNPVPFIRVFSNDEYTVVRL
ncbi:protein C-mannosyl-transferase DPY19L1-like [Ornithodoros turicata]|uniref:protein C-mannosyl-transferase DPY19L1-like n=1 Tax=Ornithodoros turicata TaxID=34597 RepID=UPI003139CEEB